MSSTKHIANKTAAPVLFDAAKAVIDTFSDAQLRIAAWAQEIQPRHRLLSTINSLDRCPADAHRV